MTGALYWKNHPRYKAWKGREAGSVYNNGYRTIELKINEQRLRYTAQRVIWMLMTGVDPQEFEVDHINRSRDCNAWHNLRLVTKSENAVNRKKRYLKRKALV